MLERPCGIAAGLFFRSNPTPSHRPKSRFFRRPWLAALAFLALSSSPEARAATPFEDVFTAIVKIRAHIPADSRTADALGTEREGTGVVIDSSGIVLTIGHLIVEAMSVEVTINGRFPVIASVLAYDHDTGFGLVKTIEPLKVKAIEFGDSIKVAERQPVLIVPFGGIAGAGKAMVVSHREYAGYWEYLLSDAIFTTPPLREFPGAALIGSDGKLLGIGSLFLSNTLVGHSPVPGNMFVPIDHLKPILAALIETGRAERPASPWLGINTDDSRGPIAITRVSDGGPAAQAGLESGDIVVAVGGKRPQTLIEFYKMIRAIGPAGAAIPLTIRRGREVREIVVGSLDRNQFLRQQRSY